MARPEKPEEEKRSYEHKVNLNYFEEQKSIELAAGRSFAQTVRELLENAPYRNSPKIARKVENDVGKCYL